MHDDYKYHVFIKTDEFQKRILHCITSEEINKFFNNTVFNDDVRYKEAMVHGMLIASMMTSYCKPFMVKIKDEIENEEDNNNE